MKLRAAKHHLKALLSPITFPIRSGPLKGLRWGVATGLPFVRGRYEPMKTEALLEILRPGQVVYDVGAHVGYFSAIASRGVGDMGRVVSFEPRPLNLRFLRSHVQRNGLANVRIVESAVGAEDGEARFNEDTGTGTGHLTDGEGRRVPLLTLDGVVARGEFPPPHVLKIDVEGGEVAVLRGASRILREHRPSVLVATHDPETHRETISLLEASGYRWRVLENRKEDSDTEILALPSTPEPEAERGPGDGFAG